MTLLGLCWLSLEENFSRLQSYTSGTAKHVLEWGSLSRKYRIRCRFISYKFRCWKFPAAHCRLSPFCSPCVAVSRLCRLSEFTPNRALYMVSSSKRCVKDYPVMSSCFGLMLYRHSIPSRFDLTFRKTLSSWWTACLPPGNNTSEQFKIGNFPPSKHDLFSINIGQDRWNFGKVIRCLLFVRGGKHVLVMCPSFQVMNMC